MIDEIKLKITIIDPKSKDEIETTNYELKNGHLVIHDLGYAYVFPNANMIDMSKPFYYTDSRFPIDNPSEQIINKYIKVEVIDNR